MINIKKLLISSTIALLGLFAFVGSVLASTPTSYFNGFETDINGWFTPTRVASGTDGIPSSTGSWHAEATTDFTRYNGYTDTFPVGGFNTSLDIYLDMSKNPTLGTDIRFDYSTAISNTSGDHRRDFIFTVGTDPAVAGQFIMSASNNSPGWPSNPGRDPLVISQTGWYTFRHTFQNNAGVLQVVMDVLDHNGTLLHSWTLSDPTDLIGTTVGGSRYSWFATNGFPFLAIDNSQLNLGKVSICHLEKKSSTNFHLISVDQDAVAAHLKHGDGLPGGDVPRTSDKQFADDCTIVNKWVLLETITVEGNNPNNTPSSITLENGKTYRFDVSGTWFNRNSTEMGDAEYYSKDNWVTETDGYIYPDYDLGLGFGDLQINNEFVDWGAYSPAHTYSRNYVGTGNLVNFLIFDGNSHTNTIVPSWYGDNSGSLTVKVYSQ